MKIIRKNVILPILVVMCVTLSLSGCKKLVETDVSAETKSVKQTVSETTNSENNTEINKIESPGDGLTFDDVNIIEINGQQVSLPFTVDELGEEYLIGEEYGFNEIYTALYYKDEFIAFINTESEKGITSISFPSESLEQNMIKIYNISSNDSFEKIIDTMGIPDIQTEIALLYKFDFGELYFCSENTSQGSKGFNFVKISLHGGKENE